MGSGKTMLGNCILSYLKNNYGFTAFAINCTSLISNDGEEKLRKIFEGCKENVPAVILFDEIDVISSKEGSKRPQGSLLPYLLNSLEKINK